MRKQLHRGRSSSLVLMETILAVGFFALTAAICMRLFASAAILNEKSEALRRASLCVQSTAEVWKSQNGDENKTARLLCGETADGTIEAAFDETLTPVPEEEGTALFFVTLKRTPDAAGCAEISCRDRTGETLCTITVRTFG